MEIAEYLSEIQVENIKTKEMVIFANGYKRNVKMKTMVRIKSIILIHGLFRWQGIVQE